MEKKGERLLTIKELFEESGAKLTVDHFITKPGPCEDHNYFVPVPTVPFHLMDPEKAQEAKELLKICTGIVGLWGDRISKKETDEFKNASTSFNEITGVDPWEIMSEARQRLTKPLFVK